MISTFVSASGKPEYIIKTNILALFIATPVTFILVSNMGMQGAALSWIFYYLIGIAYIVPRIYRQELKLSGVLWFKQVVAAIALACLVYTPCWLIYQTFFPTTLLHPILLHLTATLIYGVAVLNITENALQEILVKNAPFLTTLIIFRKQKHG
jgi:O-antigen/teichoic acid export membrane protein